MKYIIDTTKAKAKIKKMMKIGDAYGYVLNKWGADTILKILRNLSGPILKTRTGHLKRNVKYKAYLDPKMPRVEIGTGIAGAKSVKYAHILEEGGTIKPVRAKALTIPFPGVKGLARNYPGIFCVKGRDFLAIRQGSGIKPLFSLKKEVTIPAFHWLWQSICETKPELETMMKPNYIKNLLGIED